VGGPDLHCVMPLPHGRGLWTWQGRSWVMGILNTTPDSFSDGGEATSVPAAVSKAQALVQDGADIIDIGGQSTRPGAPLVSPDVEMERVVPVIK
jgi:dihydropteroate synthase